jgi:hypothetical protein
MTRTLQVSANTFGKSDPGLEADIYGDSPTIAKKPTFASPIGCQKYIYNGLQAC